MLLFNPACLGCSTILVLAVFTPAAVCYKPLHICLYPQQDAIRNVQENNHNLGRECLENSPSMTSFKPKRKKYGYGPVSFIYEPFLTRAPTLSLPSVPSSPNMDFREIINVPNVHKTPADAEEKGIRLVPVIKKVTRNVVEYRTRHIPVIKRRLRTVEEKYTEHVPVMETITRPIVDTIVKHVPVIEAKKDRVPQRMRTIPNEQRAVEELMKFKQSPLYRQGNWGWSFLYPQLFNPSYSSMYSKMSKYV